MVREGIKIPNVLIVVKWDIRKGTADNGFPGIMPLLEITGTGGFRLQVYVGDVEKADTEQMNVDQQEIDKAIRYHQEMHWWDSHRSPW